MTAALQPTADYCGCEHATTRPIQIRSVLNEFERIICDRGFSMVIDTFNSTCEEIIGHCNDREWALSMLSFAVCDLGCPVADESFTCSSLSTIKHDPKLPSDSQKLDWRQKSNFDTYFSALTAATLKSSLFLSCRNHVKRTSNDARTVSVSWKPCDMLATTDCLLSCKNWLEGSNEIKGIGDQSGAMIRLGEIPTKSYRGFSLWLETRKKGWKTLRLYIQSNRTIERDKSKYNISRYDLLVRYADEPVRLDCDIPSNRLGSGEESDELTLTHAHALHLPGRFSMTSICNFVAKCSSSLWSGKMTNLNQQRSKVCITPELVRFPHPSILSYIMSPIQCERERDEVYKYAFSKMKRSVVRPKIFRDDDIPCFMAKSCSTFDRSVDLSCTISLLLPSEAELYNVKKKFSPGTRVSESRQAIEKTLIPARADIALRSCLISGLFVPHLLAAKCKYPDLLPTRVDEVYHPLSNSIVKSARKLVASDDREQVTGNKTVASDLIMLGMNYPAHRWLLSQKALDSTKTRIDDGLVPQDEQTWEVVQKFRNKSILSARLEGARNLLFTGVCMRRGLRGKCIYRGFLSESSVAASTYQRRYMSTLHNLSSKKNSLDILPRSLLPNQPNPIHTFSSASHLVMLLFKCRIIFMSNDAENGALPAQIPVSPACITLLKTPRHPEMATDRRKGKKNGGTREHCVGQFEEFVMQEKFSTPFRLCTTSTSFEVDFRSFSFESDGRKITSHFLTTVMEELGEESLFVRRELLHLRHKIAEISKEEEIFRREIAVIGGGTESKKEPMTFSPIRSNVAMALVISEGVGASGEYNCHRPDMKRKSFSVERTDCAIVKDSIKEQQEYIGMAKKAVEPDDALMQRKKVKKGTKKKKKKRKKKEKLKARKRLRTIDNEEVAVLASENKDGICSPPPNITGGSTSAATKPPSSRTVSPKPPISKDKHDIETASLRSAPAECHEKIPLNRPTVSPLLPSNNFATSRAPRTNMAMMSNFFSLYGSSNPPQAGDSPAVKRGDTEKQDVKFGSNKVPNTSAPINADLSVEADKSCQGKCDQPNETGSKTEKQASTYSPVSFLCSEQFLESNSTLTAELTSGLWNKVDIERPGSDCTKFTACDTPLVDEADVDIELSGHSAIVVTQLSSWSTENRDGDGNPKHFIRRIVRVAATGKYALLSIFICVDIPLTSIISKDISMLQTAVLAQNGSPCSLVDIQYTTSSTLSYAIGTVILDTLLDQQVNRRESDPASRSWLESYAIDLQVQERARFLMQVAPALTVFMALECVRCFTIGGILTADDSSQSNACSGMSCLIQNIAECNENNLHRTMSKWGISSISCQASRQLWMALTTTLFKT